MKITLNDLNKKIDYLNEITNNNKESYTFGKGSNIGSYYLSMAYGGHKLEQIVNKGGGCKDVLFTGYTTKKHLYYNICSYILGIESK